MTMAIVVLPTIRKHIISTFVVLCLSLSYFEVFNVAGSLLRITKEFIHYRLRDGFLLHCLCNFYFLVLSWFKIKLLLKTKNCRKQINYSRYFACPFEISHKKTRIFKTFSLVFAWFLPFLTRTIGHVLLRILEKSFKIYSLV